MTLTSPFTRFRILILLLCFLLILSVASSCASVHATVLPTSTLVATVIPAATETQTPTPTLSPTPTLVPAPTLSQAQRVCGGPSVMYILLVGSDTRFYNYDAGLADAIRLVRVDLTVPRVQLLTFPRDLYVEIPGIKSHNGITHGKLNQAYLYGNPGFGYYDGPGQGLGLLALTMELNFGVHVDHYLAVNLKTFARFVDALGGIDIRLPYEVDGRGKWNNPNRYYPYGYQHLDGYRTRLLAQMRPRGDVQRAQIQNLIMQAIAEKLLSPSTLLRLPELSKAFTASIQTDLGPEEIGRLICLSSMLDKKNIEYVDFPSDLFKESAVQDPILGYTFVWDVDFNVLKSYVQKFEDGTWPEAGK